MNAIQEWVDREIASLRTLRDELRVRAHLFKADVRDEWSQVEQRLDVIESEVVQFGKEAKEPLDDARDAAKHLITEAREALGRIERRAR